MFCKILNAVDLDKPSGDIFEECKGRCEACLVKVSIQENSFKHFFDFRLDPDIKGFVFERKN